MYIILLIIHIILITIVSYCRVQSPTAFLNPEYYECNGNERSLCECKNTKGYCPTSNTESGTVNIQCEERVSLRHEHSRE